MISRRTWQNLEFKDLFRIENNVLEGLENSRYIPFFFYSSSRFLRFPETSVFWDTPFCILETDANRKGFSWMREDLRSNTLSRIPFILRLSHIHLDASVSPTMSPTISFPYSVVNSIYSHCVFAFDGNAACGIECREIFAGATKRMSRTVKSKYLHKARHVT